MNLLCRIATGLASVAVLSVPALAADPLPPAGSASGTLEVDGESIPLRHAYVYREDQGFYDPADPTWTLVLSAEPLQARQLRQRSIDPSLRLGLTLTSEFGDGPSLRVLSNDLQAGGFSHSGGTAPELSLEQQGPDVFAGRIHLAERQDFFEHSYQYDLRFHAVAVDPDAQIGAVLPGDGGEPGAAYVAWTHALEARDAAALKALVTPDMAAMLDAPEAAGDIERMASMAPQAVRVLGGSSDGATAILRIEGRMDGAPVQAEVTLTNHDGHWIPTRVSYD